MTKTELDQLEALLVPVREMHAEVIREGQPTNRLRLEAALLNDDRLKRMIDELRVLALPMPCGWEEPTAGKLALNVGGARETRVVPVVRWDTVLDEALDPDDAEALGAALIRAAREARRP